MRTVRCAALTIALTTFSAITGSQAAGLMRVAFHIEQQPVRKALRQWAEQTGLQVVFSDIGSTLDQKTAQSVKGELEPEAALKRMLEKTDLKYEFVTERMVRVSNATEGLSVSAQSDPGQMDAVPMGGAGTAPAENISSLVLQEVVVTGTNIRGVENRTAPVITLDSQYIERTGYGSTRELFRSLPQNFSGGDMGASEDGRFGTGTSRTLNLSQSTGINLRGLGNSSTLVLVNGRRLAPSSLGAIADISHIPLSAIERVEILTDGSSAIYGSDAVGGVVNIILKKEYEGADTRLRFGSVSSGSREESGIAQALGIGWSSGNALLSLDYQDISPLFAAERDFMPGYLPPTYLLPDSRSAAGALNLRQDISENLILDTDILYSRRKLAAVINQTSSLTDQGSRTENTNAGSRISYRISPRWSAEFNVHYGREDEKREQVITRPVRVDLNDQFGVFELRSADVLLAGRSLEIAGKKVSVALGGAYREEEYRGTQVQKVGAAAATTSHQISRRDVTAVYGEAYLSLISPDQEVSMIHSMELSGAVRYDDYSDFGSTTNPRLGIYWAPVKDIAFRAAYSKAFRAPHVGQLIGANATPVLLITRFANPDGLGQVPAFALTSGGLRLTPERARTLSLGLECTPALMPGLKITTNYYSIRYRDRIYLPGLDTTALLSTSPSHVLVSTLADDAAAIALLDAVIAQGGRISDLVGAGPSGIRYVYDGRQRNVAKLNQSGIDLGVEYVESLGSGQLHFRLALSKIRYIDVRLLSTSTINDTVDTLGNPTDLRGRMDINWKVGGWSIGSGINYADDYVNASVVGFPPIGDWLTVDLFAQMKLGEVFRSRAFSETALNVSVQNVFGEDPPFAATASGANYDPANASPLGRFIAIEFRKRW